MIYLDYNATTPLHPRAREAMLPWLGGGSHGNPSSVHRFGQAAREAVETARQAGAALIRGRPGPGGFPASEHPSIREAAARLEEEGMEVTRVSPRGDGVVPVEDVAGALRPDTRLVALMLANNELGTLPPVAAVAAVCPGRRLAAA